MIKQRKISDDELELLFEFDEDEYNELYEQYEHELTLKDNPNDYSIEDFLSDVMEIGYNMIKLEQLKKEKKNTKKLIKVLREQIQAKQDGNNN